MNKKFVTFVLWYAASFTLSSIFTPQQTDLSCAPWPRGSSVPVWAGQCNFLPCCLKSVWHPMFHSEWHHPQQQGHLLPITWWASKNCCWLQTSICICSILQGCGQHWWLNAVVLQGLVKGSAPCFCSEGHCLLCLFHNFCLRDGGTLGPDDGDGHLQTRLAVRGTAAWSHGCRSRGTKPHSSSSPSSWLLRRRHIEVTAHSYTFFGPSFLPCEFQFILHNSVNSFEQNLWGLILWFIQI